MKKLEKQNDGNQRNSDWLKISEQPKFSDRDYFRGGKKIEEDLDLFFNNNASQPKNKTVQHDKNKVTKFLD